MRQTDKMVNFPERCSKFCGYVFLIWDTWQYLQGPFQAKPLCFYALLYTLDTRVSNCPQPACNSGVQPLAISLIHLCRNTAFSVPVLPPGTSTAHCQAQSPGSNKQPHPSTTGKLQSAFSLDAPAGTNRTLFSAAGTNARHLIYLLKNSSNAVCRITGSSRNLICRKMHRECSLYSLRVQREPLQLEEQCAFNAPHQNLSQAPTNSN